MEQTQAILLTQASIVSEADRRRERRYAIPKPAHVKLRIPPESDVIEAEVLNVSRNGIGLISRNYITPGMQIMFRFSDQCVFARVRHCRPTEDGFIIGALIREVVFERDQAERDQTGSTSPQAQFENVQPEPLLET